LAPKNGSSPGVAVFSPFSKKFDLGGENGGVFHPKMFNFARKRIFLTLFNKNRHFWRPKMVAHLG
jgi:hypothetical protein